MVDILLATHNSEKYLAELLDSLTRQTCGDIRIIVSDDGSADDTLKIAQKYAAQNGNFTILENNLPLGGAKQNFFYLLRHSNAEYAMFADHDDVWGPNKVLDTLSLMREMEAKFGEQTPLLVHTDLEVVDENLRTVAPSLMRAQNLNKNFVGINKLMPQNYVTGCTMMMNRSLVNKVKYINMEPIVMHDWWVALVTSAFGKIAFLDQPTIKYRQHPGNEIGAIDVRSTEYVKENLSNTGKLRTKIRNTYLQAGAFYETYKGEFTPENEEIVKSYAEFTHLNKFGKWHRMIKYDYFKNGVIRKIGQFILG